MTLNHHQVIWCRTAICLVATVVLVLCSAVLLYSASSDGAQGASSSGSTGDLQDDNFRYILKGSDGGKYLEIVEYLKSSTDTSESFTIPATAKPKDCDTEYPIGSVSSYVFRDCLFKEVYFGMNLVEIDSSNFINCPNLEEVTLDENLTYIGPGCFTCCNNLKVIDCGTNSYFEFDDVALYSNIESTLIVALNACLANCEDEAGNKGVYTVSILTISIGDSAFRECTNIVSVNLPSTTTSIEDTAFISCSNLKHVNKYNDSFDDLTNDCFPDRLLLIGSMAFKNCSSLTDFTLSDNLRVIEDEAFKGCSAITSVNLGYNVNSIGAGAFSSCTSLEAINVSEDNSTFSSLDGVLFKALRTNSVSELVQYPAGAQREVYEVPDSVDSIDSYAFSGLSATCALKEVVLSKSIVFLAYAVFYECESLEKINIPAKIVSLNDWLFYGCINLKTVVFQSELVYIGCCAFTDCVSLTAVTLPETLTEIDISAFAGCKAITSITLPKSVESVRDAAFSLSGLKRIIVNGDDTTFEENSLSVGVEGNKSTLVVECDSSLKISDEAFGEYTESEFEYFDEKPYPYENWIVIAICVVILFFLIRYIRRV